ncbi:HAMP domain-containing sensor histidine kinase [Patulibacter defluvii]|uniref:HAMP domain-containing sensor histidine kinase n=1 Tax=Patulibacter defluvii TaxID=3095358 RepID=UPI002A75F456|nr:HAMP domain-containing sensor histidine kinase [Patulibacter sp. DM4]
MSLRRRLVLLTAGAVSLAIVLASVVTYAVVRGNLRDQVDTALKQLAPQVTVAPALPATADAPLDPRAVDGALSPPSATTGARRAGRTAVRPEAALRLLDPKGRRADDPAGERAWRKALDALSAEVERVGGEPGKPITQLRIRVPRDELGGASGVAQVVTPTGDVVVSTMAAPMLPVDGAARAVARGDDELLLRDETVRGRHVRVLTVRDGFGGALQVARPLTEVDDALARLRWILLAVCLGGLVVGGGLGLGVSRATVRPVARLTDAAEQVTETGDLGHRIDQPGEDELGRLARSFNRMLGALEASRDAQRALVADASHELRTPLTSARANIELLQRAPDLPADERATALGDVRRQLEELTVLVGDLVDLARPREQLVDEPEELDLDALVADAVARAQRNAPRVRFALERAPTVVRGSRMRLTRAVSNLLDNAAKFSPDGATVEVDVRDGTVTVRDHGPGVDPGDLPHVFDRFWRAPAARGLPGSGLGLAIVRHVAEGHDGRVEAANAAGGGALLRLTLPTVAAPSSADS